MSELKTQMTEYAEAIVPRYAAQTVLAYKAGVCRFERYCEEVGVQAAAEITEVVLSDYHAWLRNFSLSESTVGLGVRSAKNFLKWAYSSGLTLYDGSSYGFKHPRSKVPEPPTVAVMQRLLELPNQQTAEGLRDLFLLELLYGLGLRRMEASTRDLNDLDLVRETLFVKGKHGDERLLPVGLKLKDVAQRYLFEGRPRLLPSPSESALLLDDEGRRLPLTAILYIVKKYGKMLDLRLSPHYLRHACATHLVERGMRLTDVQRLLGHRNISSTKHYAQISQAEMNREFHRSHPRSKRD